MTHIPQTFLSQKLAHTLAAHADVRDWLLNPEPALFAMTPEELDRSFIFDGIFDFETKKTTDKSGEPGVGPTMPQFSFPVDNETKEASNNMLKSVGHRDVLYFVNKVTDLFAFCTIFAEEQISSASNSYKQPLSRRVIMDLTQESLLTYQVAWHTDGRFGILVHNTVTDYTHTSEFIFYDTLTHFTHALPDHLSSVTEHGLTVGQAITGYRSYALMPGLPSNLQNQSQIQQQEPFNTSLSMSLFMSPIQEETIARIQRDDFVARVTLNQIDCPFCDPLGKNCDCEPSLRVIFEKRYRRCDTSFKAFLTSLVEGRDQKSLKFKFTVEAPGFTSRQSKVRWKTKIRVGGAAVLQYIQTYYFTQFWNCALRTKSSPKVSQLEQKKVQEIIDYQGDHPTDQVIDENEVEEEKNCASIGDLQQQVICPKANHIGEIIRALRQMTLPSSMVQCVAKRKAQQEASGNFSSLNSMQQFDDIDSHSAVVDEDFSMSLATDTKLLPLNPGDIPDQSLSFRIDGESVLGEIEPTTEFTYVLFEPNHTYVHQQDFETEVRINSLGKMNDDLLHFDAAKSIATRFDQNAENTLNRVHEVDFISQEHYPNDNEMFAELDMLLSSCVFGYKSTTAENDLSHFFEEPYHENGETDLDKMSSLSSHSNEQSPSHSKTNSASTNGRYQRPTDNSENAAKIKGETILEPSIARVRSSIHKRHHCHKCEAAFSRPRDLKRHVMSVHEKQRPFKCIQCSSSFYQKWNYELHVKSVHEKIKSFTCDQCSATFARNGDLTKHVRIVHLKFKPHECDECGSSFSQMSDLKRHLNKVHKFALSAT